MVQDIPELPAYSQTAILNNERGYSIRLPDPNELRAGRDAAGAEAALLRQLDASADIPATDAAGFGAGRLPAEIADGEKFHSATRVGLIVGGSALLWAAIAYGVLAIL